jgi:hypothetical protein
MFGHGYFFSFSFIHSISYFFYFYYILLISINKFNGHKRVNVSFYEIKYLDISLSFICFSVSFLVIIKNFIYLFT